MKNKLIRYIADRGIALHSVRDVFELVHELFASVVKTEEFEKRKDTKIKYWHVCFVAVEVTEALRPSDGEEDITTYLSAFRAISDRGLGTRAIFYFKAGLPDRLQYRIMGCCCSPNCNDSSDPGTSACRFIHQHYWDSQCDVDEQPSS